MSYLSVMDISLPFRTLLKGDFRDLSIHDYLTILRDLRETGGIDVTPLKDLLVSIIPEDVIRSSDIDYGLVVFRFRASNR